MRKSILIVALLLGSTFAFADNAGTVIERFTAHTNGDAIQLSWGSSNESGVVSYSIERSEVNGSDFQQIATVNALGNYSSYNYTDSHITSIMTSGSSQASPNGALSNLYKYRLCINYANAISYSQTIYVTTPSSGVKRTWGMIKEMFH